MTHNPVLGHLSSVSLVYFQSNGLLASISRDSVINLWDTETAAQVRQVKLTGDDFSDAFSSSGLFATGLNGTVQLYNFTTGAILTTLIGRGGRISSLAFDSKGLLASGSYGTTTIKLWNTEAVTLTTVTMMTGNL